MCGPLSLTAIHSSWIWFVTTGHNSFFWLVMRIIPHIGPDRLGLLWTSFFIVSCWWCWWPIGKHLKFIQPSLKTGDLFQWFGFSTKKDNCFQQKNPLVQENMNRFFFWMKNIKMITDPIFPSLLSTSRRTRSLRVNGNPSSCPLKRSSFLFVLDWLIARIFWGWKRMELSYRI